MKRVILAVVCCLCAVAVSASAADKGKEKRTSEQKDSTKKLVQKYDTNQDGKLSKEERAKMTPEDKQEWQKAHPKKNQGHKATK